MDQQPFADSTVPPPQVPATPPAPAAVDPVLSHLMRPTVQTGEGQFAVAVTLLTGAFVLAVGEHWFYVTPPVESFVLTWIPIGVPAGLGTALIFSRSALKLFLGRRYVAAQEAALTTPGAVDPQLSPPPTGTAQAGGFR